MRTYLTALVTMILLSFGQVLLKILAVKMAAANVSLENWQRAAAPLLGYGAAVVAVYLAVLACWLYVLKSLELSRAFAFVALTFIFVPLLSNVFLHEKITTGTAVGATLIVAGIVIAANY